MMRSTNDNDRVREGAAVAIARRLMMITDSFMEDLISYEEMGRLNAKAWADASQFGCVQQVQRILRSYLR